MQYQSHVRSRAAKATTSTSASTYRSSINFPAQSSQNSPFLRSQWRRGEGAALCCSAPSSYFF